MRYKSENGNQCVLFITLQSLEDKTARMRKEYEQRLDDLAESKRQALREMNNMFEAKLEEKDVLLLEVNFLIGST